MNEHPKSKALRPALMGAALVMVAGAAVLGHGVESATGTWVTYGALFLPYGWWVCRCEKLGGGSLWVLVATALLARFVLVFAEPVLSDDIFRYVWDGRVAAAGINPYRYAPGAEALASLRDGVIWPTINHPSVPTIYPPVAQYLFEMNAHVGGGVAGLKALLVGVESAAVASCVWWCRRNRVEWSVIAAGVALYALNPLVIVEVAYSGHIDVLAWSLLIVALVIWRWPESEGGISRSGWRLAAIAGLVGLSIGAKFLSLAVLPFLLFDGWVARAADGGLRVWGRRVAMCLGAVGVVAVTYLPYVAAGGSLFDGFGTYAASWRNNDGGYRLVRAGAEWGLESAVDCSAESAQRGRVRCEDGQVLVALEGLNPVFRAAGWTKQWRGETLPDTTWTAEGLASTTAKAVAVFVTLLVMSAAIRLGASPAGGLLAVLVALYLFAPVVHPWYVAWLVPLSVLARARVGLVFSAVVLLGYASWWSQTTGGTWHVPSWVVAVEYGVVVVAAWLDVLSGGWMSSVGCRGRGKSKASGR